MTDREKIEALRETAEREWRLSNEALACHYHALAEIDAIQGDEDYREFHAALAACYRDDPGAVERKDRAYAALTSKLDAGAEPGA